MLRTSFVVAAVVACLAACLGCRSREHWPGIDAKVREDRVTTAPDKPAPDKTAEAPPLAPLPANAAGWTHPRIFLTPARLAAIEGMQRSGHPSWRAVEEKCNEATRSNTESGYEAEDWAHNAVNLALCWRIHKGRDDYARASVKYVIAMLDDLETVGDHKGGERVVAGNDGYSIRNRGCLAAVAYDWLSGSDALSPDVKKKIITRVHQYLTWYRKDGYKRDDAISNHYMGHFCTAAAAGLAMDGEDPRGREMRELARKMWHSEVIPGFRKVDGGDFTEGWQYARTVGASIAIYVDGESRAPGGNPKVIDELPWLRQSVVFQTHALLPDGIHMYDNADWSKKPARPYPAQWFLTSLAIPEQEPLSAHALWLGRQSKQPDMPLWEWAQAAGDNPGRQGADPRKGPTSYLAKGTGTVLARTNWSDSAVWASLTDAPFYSDHQHLDQGHFELVRGSDQLIIDPGDYDSYSTMSHNSILVEDKKENNRYSPNQNTHGMDVGIRRFQDEGGVVYALADFTTAYNPDDYPEYKKTRSVTRAEREWVFSRTPVPGMNGSSARLVLYDRVAVTKPGYGVTWTGHASVNPRVTGALTSVVLGKSVAHVAVLLPPNAAQKLLVEPTIKTDDIFMQNTPAEGIHAVRFETESPKGTTERRFLHAIATGAAGDPAPPATRIEGDGIDGAALADEAYVFSRAGAQSSPAAMTYTAPVTAIRHHVFDMPANQTVTVTATRNGATCKVTITPGGARKATGSGVLVITLNDCALK